LFIEEDEGEKKLECVKKLEEKLAKQKEVGRESCKKKKEAT
jgi:hypothetical protein